MKNNSQSSLELSPRTAGVPRMYKWELIALLCMAYFLNQGDRQIYNAILGPIAKDLLLSDFQRGLVTTLFTWFYGVLVPFAGCLGDFISKKWIVVLSLLTFSIGTLLTGFAGGFIMLVIFRSIATGAGEAIYYPAANALIGQYHSRTRAQAMAIHQTALYVGIVVVSGASGWAASLYGWRSPFYVFGSLGIIMAMVVALRFRNERHDAVIEGGQSASGAPQPRLGEAIGAVLRKPTLYMLTAAFACMVFVDVGWKTWISTFFQEKFGFSVFGAAFYPILFHHVGAFVGVMVGSRLSDRLAPRRKTIRMETGFIGLLLGAPFIFLMGWSSQLVVVCVALACFGLFRGIYDSNLFAALFDVIPVRYRSTATGLMLAFAFAAGANSSALLGYFKSSLGLSVGLSSLAAWYLIGGIVIFIAIKLFFARDYIDEAGRS